MITITGGKWTTYRKMAEDVINNAAQLARLPASPCVTKNLSIGIVVYDGSSILHSTFRCTQEDIRHFIEHEMAMTPEDILARRTRFLLLDAHAALAMVEEVTKVMASIMQKDGQWVSDEIARFRQLAAQYIS